MNKIGDIFINNKNLKFKIISDLGENWEVEFLDSGYKTKILKTNTKNKVCLRDLIAMPYKIMIDDIKTNNDGLQYKILKSNGKNNFRIKFIESGNEYDVYGSAIKKGNVRDSKSYDFEYSVGKIRTTNSGLQYKIIQKYDSTHFRIKFIESGFEKNVLISHMSNNIIKDDSLCDIFISIGKRYINNDGYEFEIINIESNNITIRFIESGYVTTVVKNSIYNLTVTDKSKLNSYINIGDIRYNNIGLEYIIIGKTDNEYYIKFTESGFSNNVSKNSIISGGVKDYLHPSICGVGYLGYYFGSTNIREYHIWKEMIYRCYKKDSSKYKFYGAIGVTVDSRWHCFKTFMDDIPFIPGYNKYLFDNGLLHLDKDLRSNSDKKIYSLETCTFLKPYLNLLLSQNRYVENNMFIPALIVPAHL